jgi:hypothetical protein
VRGLPYDSKVKIDAVQKKYKGKCFWCGCKTLKKYQFIEMPLLGLCEVDDTSPTMDHVVPLMRQENTTHGHTWDNVVLSCMGCNVRKNDTLIDVELLECESPVKYIQQSRASETPNEGGESPPFLNGAQNRGLPFRGALPGKGA